MAGSKFQYDESGGTFFYFLFSFLALVVIPCTYYFWPKRKDKTATIDRNVCQCEPCAIKSNYLENKEPWRKVKDQAIKFLLLSGWLALILTGYKVLNLKHDYVAWDPFEVLGIDPGSTPAEIKKAYRSLSLIFHPDKETGDEKKFLLITKAFRALTNEEARKNWEMYGNPDGPGATSFGIALPSWIVEKENSFLVLGLYALVVMIALPVAVGVWWYRSVKYGTDQVLLDTTYLYYYFLHKTPDMALKRALMIISASGEFHRRQNSEIIERPSDNYEVNCLMKELSTSLGENNKEKPLYYPYSLKARALLHAHLSRKKLPPSTLEIDRMKIVKKCPILLQEFVQCVGHLTLLALAGRISRKPHVNTLENGMKLSRLIVQALWESKSPLLQLPHITEDMLRFFSLRKRGSIRSIRDLAAMKEDDRRSLLRSLTDEHYHNVMLVMSRMPLLSLTVKTEVVDDEDSSTITTGAIVTVTVHLKRQSMKVLMEGSVNGVSEDFGVDHNKEPGDSDEETAQGDAQAGDSPKMKKGWNRNKGKKKGSKGAKMKKRVPVPQKQKQSNQAEQQDNQQPQQPQQQNDLPIKANGTSHSVEKPPKDTKSSSKINESDEEDVESHSDVSEASSMSNRVEEKHKNDDDDEEEWNKCQQKLLKRDKVLETKPKKSHSVHCPYFPDDKQEFWWIYMLDRRRQDLISVPVFLTSLVDEEQVELKVTAPHKPGIYRYWVIVRSDSYVDCDVMAPVKLDVKEAKAVPISAEWDISEEEEANKDDDSAVEDSDLVASDDDDDDESD